MAPQACVRVYARMLVPPHLYIHTYIPLRLSVMCVCFLLSVPIGRHARRMGDGVATCTGTTRRVLSVCGVLCNGLRSLDRRFIYKEHTITHAKGTEPSMALGSYGELPLMHLDASPKPNACTCSCSTRVPIG